MLDRLLGRTVPERRQKVRDNPEYAEQVASLGERIDSGLQRLEAAAGSLVKEGEALVQCLSETTGEVKECFAPARIKAQR